VFREIFPNGPVQILGEPLPDIEDMMDVGINLVSDPHQGPAVALFTWARSEPPPVVRWWAVPCDQVAWTAPDLLAWYSLADAADPKGRGWVMVQESEREQPLGGFIGSTLLPSLASFEDSRVRDLVARMPRCIVKCDAYRGLDEDDPADLEAWAKGWPKGPEATLRRQRKLREEGSKVRVETPFNGGPCYPETFEVTHA
jgi:hypothetical protein